MSVAYVLGKNWEQSWPLLTMISRTHVLDKLFSINAQWLTAGII